MMSGKACLRGGRTRNRRSGAFLEGGGGKKKMKKEGKKEGEKNRNEGAQNVINHKYR